MQKWFCPPTAENVASEVDLRAGGRYRIAMKDRQTGEMHITGGTYQEVSPPERLVFTWLWEGQNPATHETLVTVEFRDRGDETEITLKHERFPDQNMCDQHNQGWNGCLDRLEKFL